MPARQQGIAFLHPEQGSLELIQPLAHRLRFGIRGRIRKGFPIEAPDEFEIQRRAQAAGPKRGLFFRLPVRKKPGGYQLFAKEIPVYMKLNAKGNTIWPIVEFGLDARGEDQVILPASKSAYLKRKGAQDFQKVFGEAFKERVAHVRRISLPGQKYGSNQSECEEPLPGWGKRRYFRKPMRVRWIWYTLGALVAPLMISLLAWGLVQVLALVKH